MWPPAPPSTASPIAGVCIGLSSVGWKSISEASRHIPDDLKALAPGIPWRQIAAIGNLLRHDYQRADMMATWNIVKEHLPPLAIAIEQLIVETGRRESGGNG